MDEIYSFEPCAESGKGHLLGHEISGSRASKSLALCSYLGASMEDNESSLVSGIHIQYYVVLTVAHGDHCQVSMSFLYPSFQWGFST